MELSLKAEARRFIKTRLREYGSAEEVVQAGLAALEQQETFGDFAPGELNALLKEGERSIQRQGTVEASEVFAELKRRSQRYRRTRKAG